MKKNIILMVLMLSTSIFAEQDLKVSGHLLGVLNVLQQENNDRSQFDFATNLNFEYKLSEKITGIVQLQGGTGEGSLGFVGPGAEVTDLNINYEIDKSLNLTMGSFDTPFGQEVGYLSNNADTTNHVFLSNSLLYSAFAGPVGTLNTVGLMSEKETHYGSWILSATNGTGENSINENNTFQTLLGFKTDKLMKNLSTSITYMMSDDSADVTNNASNSFGSEFSGILVDAVYTIGDAILLKSYLGQLSYDENNVQVGMIEAEYKTDSLTYGARVSAWDPEDGVSVNPGYGSTNSGIVRYQLGTSTEIDPNVWLKTELLLDSYNEGDDVTGLMVYINAGF